ncbi:hypothetical protein HY947_03110 [Candidatus Gottesmanbacteria bacterium]|nr:hypothetical protein [Candidatus Gottesmanbacteria bacterium]
MTSEIPVPVDTDSLFCKDTDTDKRRMPIQDMNFFTSEKPGNTFLVDYLKQAETILQEVQAFCDRNGLTWYLRGSSMDTELLKKQPNSTNLCGVRQDIEDLNSTVSIWDSAVKTKGNTVVHSGALDIKIITDDEAKLSELHDQIARKNRNRREIIPPVGYNLPEYLTAHTKLIPMKTAHLDLAPIPESPKMHSLSWIYHEDKVLLPKTFDMRLTPDSVDRLMAHIDNPYQIQTTAVRALYITCDSQQLRNFDRSTTDRTTNIDALSAQVESKNGKLFLLLPKIPDSIDFSPEAMAYYTEKILKEHNMHTMERFVEVVVRSMRKAQTFSIQFSDQCIAYISKYMDTIAVHWFHADFPHDNKRTVYHNQELDVTATINAKVTLQQIYELHIYKLMHPMVSTMFESIVEFQDSEVRKNLLTEQKSVKFQRIALDRAIRDCITPAPIDDPDGRHTYWEIVDQDIHLFHLETNPKKELFRQFFHYLKLLKKSQ